MFSIARGWCHLGSNSLRNAGHSRFRGNDRGLQGSCVANDTGTRRSVSLLLVWEAAMIWRMRIRLVVELDRETKRWSAVFPELPGCGSAGDTEQEAAAHAKEALALWFEPPTCYLRCSWLENIGGAGENRTHA